VQRLAAPRADRLKELHQARPRESTVAVRADELAAAEV
jgi:hypothetical protein